LFFGDAFGGHGGILAVPQRIVKLAGKCLYAERRRGTISPWANGIGRDARVICWRPAGAVTVTSAGCSLCTDQPFDRFPQWMQRRKMEPDEQVIPKS
jgi:hypothetical protein